MSLLVIEAIKKTYHTGAVLTPALRGLSLTIEPGEFTAIVGPSGSGKTTLMNMIGGLDIPDEGSIKLNGEVLTGKSQTALSDIRLWHIGFIFQAYNLIPVLTALENVEYVMLLQGLPEKERRERSMSALRDLGIEELAHKRPSEMSGGQQQRVAVARAIVSEPKLVLADEPTANLDSETSGRLLDMMRNLNERNNITFIFSTHDSHVVDRARRILVIEDGVIADDRQQKAA